MPVLQLISSTPPRNAIKVATQPTITLRFSADLDAATATPDRFFFTRTNGPAIIAIDPDSLVVDGEFVHCAALPDGDADGLWPETDYTFTITAGLRDVVGNALATPVTIPFTTGAEAPSAPARPSVLEPVTGAALSDEALTVRLQAVDGALQYDLELSLERTFATLAIPRVTADAPTIGPITMPADPGQYFIRARARNASGVSAWSEPVAVYYQQPMTRAQEPPEIGDLWATPFGFSLIDMTPASGTVNRTPARIVFTFTSPLPLTPAAWPAVTAEALFGAARAEIGDDAWSVDEEAPTRLICEPGDGFAENTTYTIEFPDGFADASGNRLVGETRAWFTTKFSVLYAAPRQLRLRLGELAEGFTDEQLYYSLFLASVDQNIADADAALDLSEAVVAADTVTVEMTQRTIARATYALIEERLREITAVGSTKRSLGDLFESHTYDNIEALISLRDQAAYEINMTVGAVNSVRSSTLSSMESLALAPTTRTTI